MSADKDGFVRHKKFWLASLAVAALTLLVAIVPGCSSMKKDVLGRRLEELSKNRPVREAGVQLLTAPALIEGREIAASWRYHRAGERGRPVIVLVHGTPSSLFTWTELVHGGPGFEGLARDFDVIALDVIGHSATVTQLERYSFQACADWVVAFLAALDLRDVTLVGQSYGGEFAWRAALGAPQRVARVVLLNSSGVPRREGEWLPEEVKLREWSVARLGWMLNSRSRLLGALQPHFAEPVPTERLEEYFLVCENSDNWSACVDLARDENGTRVEDLRNLRAPVLLLWGARDIAYPPQRFAVEFQQRLPDSRLVLVETSGHYPHEEAPARVASELRSFIAATKKR